MGGVAFQLRPHLDQGIAGGDGEPAPLLVGGGVPGHALNQSVHPQQRAAGGGDVREDADQAEPKQCTDRVAGVVDTDGPPQTIAAVIGDRSGVKQVGRDAVGIEQGGDLEQDAGDAAGGGPAVRGSRRR